MIEEQRTTKKIIKKDSQYQFKNITIQIGRKERRETNQTRSYLVESDKKWEDQGV